MPQQARTLPAGQSRVNGAQRQAASAILNRDQVPSPMTPAKVRAKRASGRESTVSGKDMAMQSSQIINHSTCPVKLFPMENNQENIHPQAQDRESNFSMYSRQSTVLGSARNSSVGRPSSFAAAAESSRFVGQPLAPIPNLQVQDAATSPVDTGVSMSASMAQDAATSPVEGQTQSQSCSTSPLVEIRQAYQKSLSESNRIFCSPPSPEKENELERQLAAMRAEEEALDALHGELRNAMDCGAARAGTVEELEAREIEGVRSQIQELQQALQQEKERAREDLRKAEASAQMQGRVHGQLQEAVQSCGPRRRQTRSDKREGQRKEVELARSELRARDWESEAARLRTMVATSEAQREELEQQVARGEERVATLKEAVRETQHALLQLREQVEGMRGQVEERDRSLQARALEVERLEAAVREGEMRTEDLRRDGRQREEEMERLQERLAEWPLKMQHFSKSHEEADRMMLDKLREAENDKAALARDLEERARVIADLEGKLVMWREETRGQVEDANRRLMEATAALSNDFDAAVMKEKELRAELDKVHEELKQKQLKDELDRAQARESQVEAEGKEKERRELEEQLAALQAQHASDTASLHVEIEELTGALREAEEAAERCDRLKEEVERLQQEAEALQHERDMWLEQASTLDAECARNASAMTEASKAMLEVQQHRAELVEAKEALARSEGSLQGEQQATQQLQEKLQSSKHDARLVQNQLGTMQVLVEEGLGQVQIALEAAGAGAIKVLDGAAADNQRFKAAETHIAELRGRLEEAATARAVLLGRVAETRAGVQGIMGEVKECMGEVRAVEAAQMQQEKGRGLAVGMAKGLKGELAVVGAGLEEARKGVLEEKEQLERVLAAAKEAKRKMEEEREGARREASELEGKLRELEGKGEQQAQERKEEASLWRRRAETSQRRYESLVEQHLWFEGEVENLCDQLGTMEVRMDALAGAVMAGEEKARRQELGHKTQIDLLISNADRIQEELLQSEAEVKQNREELSRAAEEQGMAQGRWESEVAALKKSLKEAEEEAQEAAREIAHLRRVSAELSGAEEVVEKLNGRLAQQTAMLAEEKKERRAAVNERDELRARVRVVVDRAEEREQVLKQEVDAVEEERDRKEDEVRRLQGERDRWVEVVTGLQRWVRQRADEMAVEVKGMEERLAEERDEHQRTAAEHAASSQELQRQVDDLKNNVEAEEERHAREVEALRETMEGHLGEREQECAELKQRVEALSSACEEAAERIGGQHELLESERSTVRELQEQRRQAEAKAEKLLGELEAAASRAKAAEKLVKRERETSSLLSEERKASVHALDHLEEQMGTIIEAMQRRLNDNGTQLQTLETEKKALLEQAESVKQRLSAALQENASLRSSQQRQQTEEARLVLEERLRADAAEERSGLLVKELQEAVEAVQSMLERRRLGVDVWQSEAEKGTFEGKGTVAMLLAVAEGWMEEQEVRARRLAEEAEAQARGRIEMMGQAVASADEATEYLRQEEKVLEELAMIPGQLCGTLSLTCAEIARDKAERDVRVGREFAAMTAELEEARERVAVAERKREELQGGVEAMKEWKERLEAELAEALQSRESSVAQLAAQLSAAVQEGEGMRDTLLQLQAKLDAGDGDRSQHANDKLRLMEALGVSPTASPSKGVERAQTLKQEVSVARQALEEELRRGGAELQRRTELEAEVERREESIEALKQQFSAMRVELYRKQQALTEVEEEREEAKKSMDLQLMAMQDRVTALQAQLQQYQEAEAEQGTMQRTNSSLENKGAALSAAEEEIAALQRQLAAAIRDYDAKQEEVDKTASVVEQLKQMLNEEHARVWEYQLGAEAVQEEKEELEQKLAALQKHYTDACAQLLGEEASRVYESSKGIGGQPSMSTLSQEETMRVTMSHGGDDARSTKSVGSHHDDYHASSTPQEVGLLSAGLMQAPKRVSFTKGRMQQSVAATPSIMDVSEAISHGEEIVSRLLGEKEALESAVRNLQEALQSERDRRVSLEDEIELLQSEMEEERALALEERERFMDEVRDEKRRLVQAMALLPGMGEQPAAAGGEMPIEERVALIQSTLEVSGSSAHEDTVRELNETKNHLEETRQELQSLKANLRATQPVTAPPYPARPLPSVERARSPTPPPVMAGGAAAGWGAGSQERVRRVMLGVGAGISEQTAQRLLSHCDQDVDSAIRLAKAAFEAVQRRLSAQHDDSHLGSEAGADEPHAQDETSFTSIPPPTPHAPVSATPLQAPLSALKAPTPFRSELSPSVTAKSALKDDTLAAKLAARRRWEEQRRSMEAQRQSSQGVIAQGVVRSVAPPATEAAAAATAPNERVEAGKDDDLRAKLEARRAWEEASRSSMASAAGADVKASAAQLPGHQAPAPHAFLPGSAPDACVAAGKEEDLAARLAARRAWEEASRASIASAAGEASMLAATAPLRQQGALSTMPKLQLPSVPHAAGAPVLFRPGMAPDAAVGDKDEDLAAKLSARRQWEEATRASLASAADAQTPKCSARPVAAGRGVVMVGDMSLMSAYGAGGAEMTPTSLADVGAESKGTQLDGAKFSIESAYGAAAESPDEGLSSVSADLPAPVALLQTKGPRFMF